MKYLIFVGALSLAGAAIADESKILEMAGEEFRSITNDFPLLGRSPLDIADSFLLRNDLQGSDFSVITRRNAEGSVIVDLSVVVKGDDSIVGERYRMLLSEDAGLFTLEDVGVQFECGRGPTVGEYQAALCP